jgi:hypothetical protein
MNPQPELFPTAGAGFKPDPTRSEPIVWVRELVVLREFKPGEENVVRRIKLRPGLNILWARPRAITGEPRLGEAGVFGHASGKTTFCRLLRHILGDAHFGNDDLRQRVRDKFPSGWVVGEVMVDMQPWLVCRPFSIGPHPFVVRNATLDRLFDPELKRDSLQTYLDELNRSVMEPMAVATFATSPEPIEWAHLLQWIARDQECRFAALTDFRHTSSNSEAPDMDVEDRHFLFRAAVGLINTDEQEELERNKKLVAQKQAAEKRAPLLRHQAKVAYERLKAELPELHSTSSGDLFLDAVRRSLTTDEGLLNKRITEVTEPLSLKNARGKWATVQADARAAENRVKELNESIGGLKLELQVLRGEVTQKALDDYWREKTSDSKMCLEPVARAVAFKCPLNLGRAVPPEQGKAAVQIERNAEALESMLKVRGEELTKAEAAVVKKAAEVEAALRLYTEQQTLFNEARDKLIEQRSRLRVLVRQAKQAAEDDGEATRLENSLASLEKDIRKSQAKQNEIRLKQNRALGDFGETFNRVTKAVLGSEVAARVDFKGRLLDPKVNHRGDLTSAAIDTLKILAFDIAALVSSIEGRGLHPRILIHDGPREADMAADLYQKLFLLAREIELSFPTNATPSFQYIVTTTEPPPGALQAHPWLIDPVLDASKAESRLLGMDL